MKFVGKLLTMILLLSCITSWSHGSTAEELCVSNGNTENYNLPYRAIFNNTLELSQEIAPLSAEDNLILAGNGFYYYTGYSVKTQGQVDVPAMKAYSNFSDAEMEQEITTMEELFPEIEILGDPTSAYNCHSYAWHSNSTSNSFWIDEVQLYTSDIHTTYPLEEEAAQVGDIVVYFNSEKGVVHSAIIVEIIGTTIICRSKWGASVLCEHEKDYVPGNYMDVDGETNCYIHRVTPHVGPCESSGSSSHTRTCTICGYEQQLNCSYSYTSNGNQTHTRSCNYCGNASTYVCSMEYTYTGDGSSSHTHEGTCQVCSHNVSETCTFAYMYHSTTDGANYHISKCAGCNHTKGKAIQCLYDSENNCLVCGVSKYFIATAAKAEALME